MKGVHFAAVLVAASVCSYWTGASGIGPFNTPDRRGFLDGISLPTQSRYPKNQFREVKIEVDPAWPAHGLSERQAERLLDVIEDVSEIVKEEEGFEFLRTLRIVLTPYVAVNYAFGKSTLILYVPQTFLRGAYSVRFFEDSLRTSIQALDHDNVNLLTVTTSIAVSLIPYVGEWYDSTCLAANMDFITRERFAGWEQKLVLVGLASGVGSGALLRHCAKLKVVVFSQRHHEILEEACGAGGDRALRGVGVTEEGLRKLAVNSPVSFKFVDIGDSSAEELARMIRRELRKKRTVLLNVHGMDDEIYTGVKHVIRNDEIVDLVGTNLGGKIYDASCFNRNRLDMWKKVVGPNGEVLAVSNLDDVDFAYGAIKLMPYFAKGGLRRYQYFVDGYYFVTYKVFPGSH